MANPPGSLNLAALDTRLVDALRDLSVASATRYTYLTDAYTRIWYKYPWSFTHTIASFTASSATNEYTMGDQISEVAAVFNSTRQAYCWGNKDIYMYFQGYRDDNHGGPLNNLVDIKEDGGKKILYFQQTPTLDFGHGDTIQVYACKHVIHNDGVGATATGNMSIGTDVPSFTPQFHALIMKEALLEAIKNRRDFQEMYQLAVVERDEMLKDMKRHYFTPKRGDVLRVYR